MTLSQLKLFSEIADWATENNLLPELELCYHLLGLNPKLNAVGNLATEFQHPESQQILGDWSDNLLAHRLTLFCSTLKMTAPVLYAGTTIPHVGNAAKNRQQFDDFRTKTYILTLVTNPLNNASNDEAFYWRRQLRLWLIMQNAIRITQHGYSSDSKISLVSSFLIIGFGDTRWIFIDALLDIARRFLADAQPSFERFSSALLFAANQKKSENLHTRFLNALIDVASGDIHPTESGTKVESSDTPTLPFPAFTSKKTFDVSEDSEPQQLLISEQESLLLVSIDPTHSEAQQTLSTGSIFIQQAEQSHYLPWSWNKPTPPEIDALSNWLDVNLDALQLDTRVGAAIVKVALLVGRSLARTEAFSISDSIENEWSFNTSFTRLHRKAPRRQNSWQPNNDDLTKISAFSNDWVVNVPSRISSVLSNAAASFDTAPQTLGILWRAISNDTLEVWFNRQASVIFPRLTSGKLGETLSQQIFDRTGDQNIARLASSHHQSGLPGATGYATWDIAKIEQGLSLEFDRKTYEQDDTNLIGSLLQPVKALLQSEIAQATKTLAQTDQSDAVNFHNILAQYCVAALRATTGCRNLRDPFESAAHFNLKQQCVFINDKNDSGLHRGRLVPLPDQCVKLISKYFKSLRRLSDALTEHRSILAKNILDISQGIPSSMPLFFLLDRGLKWHSMADTDILSKPLFNFELPKNLFRHRYSQQLAAQGVDSEIIDGWMGHGETGVGSYGDYSLRCWKNDVDMNRAAVNSAFDTLGFDAPSLLTRIAPNVSISEGTNKYSEPDFFGETQRRRERRQRTKKAIKDATLDIELFIAGREIDTLTADDIGELIRRMLQREGAITHPRAALRMDTLVAYMKRSGDAHSRLIRKRVITSTQERSLFTGVAPSALTIFPTLQKWARQISSNISGARLSKPNALFIGTVLFAIEKRVSYSRQLIDLASGMNFRFIQHKKTYFLEYSEQLDMDDYYAGVQRHTVNYKTASLLTSGMNLSRTLNLSAKEPPAELDSLLPLLFGEQRAEKATTAKQLIQRLCDIIDQVNLVEFPGLIAGVLSGRTPTSSLPISDWLRITENIAVELPTAQPTKTDTQNLQSMLNPRAGFTVERDKIELQQNAKAFFREISDKLKSYTKHDAKRIALAIDKLCDDYEGRVSSGILLVVKWISFVIGRGLGRGVNFRALAPNTVKTYFSSLTGPFAELAYDVDLLALDSAAITELYDDMLEFKRQKANRIGYLGDRLVALHRWGRSVGLASPNWADLDIKDCHRTVSAGVITENEYLHSLTMLEQQSTAHTDEALMMSFVLLLGYRFGLRAQEAICLRRNDWCQTDDTTWVLVRNNRLRTLKHDASRRVVPLLFELDSLERRVIERTLARYEMLTGPHKTAPILCEIRDNKPELTQFAASISSSIAIALRAATSNPQHTLHHCRHSFYNRVAPLLFGADDALSAKLTVNLDAEKLRKTVLGDRHSVSRRSGMAAARLMGHARTTTGTQNYNHFVIEWADKLTPSQSSRSRSLEGALDTNSLKVLSRDAATAPDVMPNFQPPSLVNILKTTRLAALGYSFERAVELVQLHPKHTDTIKTAILSGTAHMRVKSRKKNEDGQSDWVECRDAPLAVIQSVNNCAWARMIAAAEKHPIIDVKSTTPHLSEATYLLGRNRHAFISQPEHAELLLVVMAVFNMPRSNFKAIASEISQESSAILDEYGFKIDPKYSRRLDSHQRILKNRRFYEAPSSGVVFQRNNDGTIRNSIEFAVAYLATAASLHFQESD